MFLTFWLEGFRVSGSFDFGVLDFQRCRVQVT